MRDGESTISDCLDAILATHYPAERREILVVDNGSTDGTAVEIHSRPVRYLYEAKRGVSNARNRGIAESQGEIVSFVSRNLTLHLGDIIATGTPAGVGLFRDPPVFLADGDVVEISIERIGTIRNRVRAAGG